MVCLYLLGSLVMPDVSHARTAKEIDASVDAALERFVKQVKGSRELLQVARGVLVFAGVIKVGIGVGGEYGEGALRIGGKTVAYYSIASASVGIQLGAQKKDVILVFLQDEALRKFQASQGWQVGVDGSVVLILVNPTAPPQDTRGRAGRWSAQVVPRPHPARSGACRRDLGGGPAAPPHEGRAADAPAA